MSPASIVLRQTSGCWVLNVWPVDQQYPHCWALGRSPESVSPPKDLESAPWWFLCIWKFEKHWSTEACWNPSLMRNSVLFTFLGRIRWRKCQSQSSLFGEGRQWEAEKMLGWEIMLCFLSTQSPPSYQPPFTGHTLSQLTAWTHSYREWWNPPCLCPGQGNMGDEISEQKPTRPYW